jgi:predicted permease
MRRFLNRAWHLIRRRRFEADLAEEMEFHRAMKQQELEEQGIETTQAAAAARRAFGSNALARDNARDEWISIWLRDIAKDVRFAARLLARDRRFTLAAVAALALGIAANTTIFTFINTALFKDLPFDQPRRLLALGTADVRGPLPDAPGPRRDGVSWADFQDWRAASRTFAGMAADSGATMNLSDEGRAPERFRGAFISANTFDLLRVKPVLGRGFLASDEKPGATPVLILGYAVWQSRYGVDPSVIGRTVRVNDVPSIVIGVMPAGFRYPMIAEVWQPLSLVSGLATAKRDARSLNVIGRLADSVTAAQARADLSAITERLAREHPDTNRGIAATLAPPMDGVRRSGKPFFVTLMGAVGFVLLIACANVANLLLARAATRSHEIAIRASLGATRWRIVRQLLIESVLLATIAGIVGLILSVYGVRYFGVVFDAVETAAPDRAATPYWVDLTMDGRVFAFVAALCLGTSLVFGLVPALHVSKTDVNDVLKDSGRSPGSARVRRWTGALMIFELALTLVLLTGAGLLVRSFLTRYRTDLVIDTTNLFTGRLTLPVQKYRTPEAQWAFFERLDQRLASHPALAAATIASDVPLVSSGGVSRQLSIDGRPQASRQKPPAVSSVRVGGRYFETLGLRLVQGRAFATDDAAAGRAVAIVNQRFATLFFPGEDPLGRRIRLDRPDAADNGAAAPWLTIVGVVQTLPQLMPGGLSPEAVAFAPFRAEPGSMRVVSLLVRGRSGTSGDVKLVRDEIRALDPDLPLFAVQTLDEVVAGTRYPIRMIGSLFGLLALNALILASVGLFALTAHGVAQRTHEIGIRMALGARASQVAWLFMRRTLVQLAIGLLLGLGGALAVGQLLQAFLSGTDARDPITLAGVVTLLIVVSLTACFLPARRAARLDPAAALRHE